jgi:hypothetical protein
MYLNSVGRLSMWTLLAGLSASFWAGSTLAQARCRDPFDSRDHALSRARSGSVCTAFQGKDPTTGECLYRPVSFGRPEPLDCDLPDLGDSAAANLASAATDCAAEFGNSPHYSYSASTFEGVSVCGAYTDAPSARGKAVTLPRGTARTVSLAKVSDDVTLSSALAVTLDGPPPSQLAISQPTAAADGDVTARVTVSCTAALGPVTLSLRVIDGAGLSTATESTVIVTADPVLSTLVCPARANAAKKDHTAVVNYPPPATAGTEPPR